MLIQLQSGYSNGDSDRKRDRDGERDEPTPHVQHRSHHGNAETSVYNCRGGGMATRIPDSMLRDDVIASEEPKLKYEDEAKSAADGDDPRNRTTAPTCASKHEEDGSGDR